MELILNGKKVKIDFASPSLVMKKAFTAVRDEKELALSNLRKKYSQFKDVFDGKVQPSEFNINNDPESYHGFLNEVEYIHDEAMLKQFQVIVSRRLTSDELNEALDSPVDSEFWQVQNLEEMAKQVEIFRVRLNTR